MSSKLELDELREQLVIEFDEISENMALLHSTMCKLLTQQIILTELVGRTLATSLQSKGIRSDA